MTYSRNAIYTRIVNAIRAVYPNTYCTSRLVAKPSTFPACYIHEIDRNRPLQNTQLDFQVVSAKNNTASTEAYNLMEIARQAFSDLYYREFSETNIDTGDTFTIIGRFRRVIGGGDTMPT